MTYWKDKRVLITGVTGFAGSWLAETLQAEGALVWGLERRHSTPHRENIAHLEGIILIDGDLSDQQSLIHALKACSAEVVFHLAAQSFVPQSFAAPTDTYLTNAIGTVNVLEAVRAYDCIEAMHFAGSSEEYGLVYPEETPIKETNPLRPMSPYGVSKIAGDFACYNHHKTYGIPVVRTRAFNHTGARRGQSFVTATITRQAAEIKLGQRDHFYLGNLEAARDFSDVRDIVKGYMAAVKDGKKGEVYNLCSGAAYTVKDIVDTVQMLAEIQSPIEQDASKLRPSEVPLLLGDCSKAKEDFGYNPQIPLHVTLNDLYQWQLARLSK